MTLLSAVLAGTAVLVVLGAPGPRGRLLALRARPLLSLPANGLNPALLRAVCVLAGLAAWALLGGLPGLVGGALITVLGPRGLAQLNNVDDEGARVAADLPLALDLLAACLAGGAATADAVRAVASALSGPCGSRLGRVAAALARSSVILSGD